MKILVAMADNITRKRFIAPEYAAMLGKMGEVEWNGLDRQWTSAELAQHLPGVEVCITGWGCPEFTEEALKNADRLRLIVHTGGSVAGYAGEAVYDRGIKVISGNEMYARSVAESVIAYALYALRDLGKFSRQMLAEGWRNDDFYNEGLLDRSVGLIGFGAVARHTARLLQAFGCEVWIDANHVTPEEAASYGAKKATTDEIMRYCKVISLHMAKTPETYHYIDARRLSLIPDGAVFINTARGAIVDEEALAKELKTGRFKAVLDVYEKEPLPMESPLRSMENVLLIPHMGGPTADRYPYIIGALIGQIENMLAGGESPYEITRETMRRMTR